MFERFYVTSRGKTLEARTHAGGNIAYTRMRIGDGVLPDGQSIEALTDLISPIKYIPISSAKSSGNKAVVSGAVSNLGIASSFYFREIGLYATDPVDGEILYAYANAGSNADHIPAYSTSPVDFTFAFNVTFSNTSSVTVTADSSLAFVTHGELEEEVEEAMESKCEVHRFTATIPSTGWTQNSDGLYTVSVSVPGILASDQDGDVGLVQSGSESTDAPRREAYGLLVRVSAAADAIVAYALAVPEVAIPVRLEVLR